MTRPDTPTVLVTGANSGIGSATIDALLDRDARVVATVRSQSSATKLLADHGGGRGGVRGDGGGEGQLLVELLDVTDAERAAAVIERHRPDVVINNAGAALLGALADIDDDDALAQLEAMVIGPVRLARLASRFQSERGHGRIVNVSSTLASTAMPFTGWYGAAKAALDSVTDTLRLELGPSGIAVVRVECGAVKTGAWDDAGDTVEQGDDESTAKSRKRWADLTTLVQPLFEDPDEVAKVIAEAALARRPRPVYRVGFASRLGILSNLVPTRLEDLVTRTVFSLKAP